MTEPGWHTLGSGSLLVYRTGAEEPELRVFLGIIRGKAYGLYVRGGQIEFPVRELSFIEDYDILHVEHDA